MGVGGHAARVGHPSGTSPGPGARQAEILHSISSSGLRIGARIEIRARCQTGSPSGLDTTLKYCPLSGSSTPVDGVSLNHPTAMGTSVPQALRELGWRDVQIEIRRVAGPTILV